ncbi:hypothetical protein KC19_8G127900 [Ceratodon purpureus]|uniref:Glycosyltransferase n=1 Tax=Ceratodon purpureus TaxID=3225 RepID=A0A8T0GY78_CERPU|nr:hypothetical protein KC19_8G127900 [Ceratodon purpureus]
MVRSAAGGGPGHGTLQGHDAAASALARLSSSLKPQLGTRLPAVLSVRVLLFILVVVLSLGVLVPIVSRSRSDLNAVRTSQTVPRLPHTANLHLGTNWRRYSLPQAAQAVASDGVLIVCTVSQPYLEFLNNWLISLARQNRHQAALIIAEDYATLDFVNTRWPGHAVLIPPALHEESNLRFGSQGFFNLTSRRPQYLLEILELGYSVLYNDVDMVWLADPFSYFKNKRDVYITDDMAMIKPEDHSHALPPPGKNGRTYICSCMLYLRPTEGAKLLMRAWIKELQERQWSPSHKTNDQPAFNWALNKTAGQVDVYLLPQVAFPSGGLYFKNETWRQETANKHVIVHNNYVVGSEKKLKRFRNHNLWFVEVDAGLSPLSEKGG